MGLGPNGTQKIGPIFINWAKKALFRLILPYVALVCHINNYRDQVGHGLDPWLPLVGPRTKLDQKNMAYLYKLGQKGLIYVYFALYSLGWPYKHL